MASFWCMSYVDGAALTLHVDHINGDYSDCRPANLRFICPNYKLRAQMGSANHHTRA
jgi:HNH endonuclease